MDVIKMLARSPLLINVLLQQLKRYNNISNVRAVVGAHVSADDIDLKCNGVVGRLTSSVQLGDEMPIVDVIVLQCSPVCWGKYLRLLYGVKLKPVLEPNTGLPPIRINARVVDELVKQMLNDAISHMLKYPEIVDIAKQIGKSMASNNSRALRGIADKLFEALPSAVSWHPHFGAIDKMVVDDGRNMDVYILDNPIKAALIQPQPGGNRGIDVNAPKCVYAISLVGRTPAMKKLINSAESVEDFLHKLLSMMLP